MNYRKAIFYTTPTKSELERYIGQKNTTTFIITYLIYKTITQNTPPTNPPTMANNSFYRIKLPNR